MRNIFSIYFDNEWNLNFSVHWIVYSIAFVLFLFWIYKLLKNHWVLHKNIEIESAEIGIQGQKLKIKPNYTNIDIAYKIWVELNTRKIGLSIDFEHDVIIEIYNSWYQFFGVNRELLKNLPAVKIRSDKATKELIEISTKILNEGLRPHLTKWQAKYRRWYDQAILNHENNNKTPQQIQQEYPKYEDLKKELLIINQNLMKYKKVIYELAFGE
jgi:hypothetical protein